MDISPDDRRFVKEGERIDDLELSGLRIIQDPEKFCFGMDAVLLSGYARANEKHICLDLGCGGGIVPILMSAKTKAAHLTGLELFNDVADMAKRSVALNHLENRIDIICGDIREAAGMFKAASFDVITSNPPYMPDAHGLKNPDGYLAAARHEVRVTLDEVICCASRLLKPGGSFFMVHRPFRLAEIMASLMKYDLEPKQMRLVYPYADREPNMVLLKAVRGGGSGMKHDPPLIVYDAPGMYSSEMVRDYGY